MSDQKLTIPHKFFAVIERLVKETCVKDLKFQVPVNVQEMEFAMETGAKDLEVTIAAKYSEIPVSIETTINEGVEDFNSPTIWDAEVDKLDAKIVDEKVEFIHSTTIQSIDPVFDSTVRVVDFFKKFNIDNRLMYKTTVKNLSMINPIPKVFSIQVELSTRAVVMDNLYFFRRLTVRHKTAIMSMVPEKTQLGYWREAIAKTGKEVRKLSLAGVYYGVPFDFIENMKIDYTNKSLCYNYKSQAVRPGIIRKDIALFTDLETQKTIVVMNR